MTIISALALLLVGLLWLIVSRPQPVWRGEAAAQFSASIILLPAALLALANAIGVNGDSWVQANMVLQELSLYAALPLLSLVLLSQAARIWGSPYDWERMIWGRILLGVCVMYELCRRSDVLPEMLITFALLTSAVMLAALIWHARQQRMAPVEIMAVLGMIGFSAALTLQTPLSIDWTLVIYAGLIWLWHLQQSLILRQQQAEIDVE